MALVERDPTKHSVTSLTSALHNSSKRSTNSKFFQQKETPTSRTSMTNEQTKNATESIYEELTGFTETEYEYEDIYMDQIKYIYFPPSDIIEDTSKTSIKKDLLGSSDFRTSASSEGTFSFDTMDPNVTRISESKENFFDKLGKVPNIEDIAVETLRGKFVDPLTGNDVSEEVLLNVSNYEDGISETKTNIEEISLSDKESSTMIIEEFSFEDYDKKYPEEIIQTKVQESIEENFTMIEVPSLTRRHAYATSQYEKHETHVATNIIQNFLNELIKETIRLLYQEEDTTTTQQILCKAQLFKDLMSIILELPAERKANTFLDRKAVEYYRRKGLQRYIHDDHQETDLLEMKNYKDKCEELDHLLGREVELSNVMDVKVHALIEQIKDFEQNDIKDQNSFANLVRKTFKCDWRPKLALVVNTHLSQMTNLKNEISLARENVIQSLHTLSNLQDQIKKVENIGSGRNVADFEILYSKTVALTKKIEDRQTELSRMHQSFNINLHLMTHSQLKRESIVRLIKSKKSSLSNLQEEEHLFRQQLFQTQMERKNTRRQLKELSHQCGLLDKPALLHDFDETIQILNKKRDEVDQLRKTYMDLLKKLQQQEGKMSLTLDISNVSQNNSNPKFEQKNFVRKGFV